MHKLNLDNQTTKNNLDETSVDGHNQNPSLGTSSFSREMSKSMKKPSMSKILVLCLIAVVMGVGTGFGAHKLSSKSDNGASGTPIIAVAGDVIKNGDVFGSLDENTFSDKTEGYLEAGGLDGEGSHKLLKPGGESQTVYMTSSVLDLEKFVGMEVKVWGETFEGQKAGWLMDVGRVEVLNIQGTPPEEN